MALTLERKGIAIHFCNPVCCEQIEPDILGEPRADASLLSRLANSAGTACEIGRCLLGTRLLTGQRQLELSAEWSC